MFSFPLSPQQILAELREGMNKIIELCVQGRVSVKKFCFMVNSPGEGFFFGDWLLQYFAWDKRIVMMNTEMIQENQEGLRLCIHLYFVSFFSTLLNVSGLHCTYHPSKPTCKVSLRLCWQHRYPPWLQPLFFVFSYF